MTKEEYIEALINDKSIDEGIQLAITKDSSLIGDLFVMKDDDDYWIGYTLSPNATGNGYAKEAVEGLMSYLKDHQSFKAGVLKENKSSVKLLIKLGFEFIEHDLKTNEDIYELKASKN